MLFMLPSYSYFFFPCVNSHSSAWTTSICTASQQGWDVLRLCHPYYQNAERWTLNDSSQGHSQILFRESTTKKAHEALQTPIRCSHRTRPTVPITFRAQTKSSWLSRIRRLLQRSSRIPHVVNHCFRNNLGSWTYCELSLKNIQGSFWQYSL